MLINKKSKKIMAFIMLFITLVSNLIPLSYSKTIGDSAYLKSIGHCNRNVEFKFSSGWSVIKCDYIGYTEGGKNYPAYCVLHGKDGVEDLGSYNVDLTKILDDDRLYRVIINGFPYKTPAQLGVADEYDAYMATKQAINCVMLDRDVYSLYRGINASGDAVVKLIYNLTQIGRTGTQTFETPNLSISKVGSLVENGNNYEQVYKVSSDIEISTYSISATANMPSGSFIADTNGNSNTEFKASDNFKLVIPKTSMSSNINTTIAIKGRCKTYPVFFGKTTLSDSQNYAITCDPYGDYSAKITTSINTNTGIIEVTKKDSETSSKIEGVTFQLLDSNNEQISTSKTNSNGIATFSNLYPGKYKIREISTTLNYILNSQLFDVSVEYNKKVTLTVTNEHKKGNLKINKTDLDTSKPISDVSFELRNSDGTVVASGKTDTNGNLEFQNIRIGNYKLVETATRNEYVLNSTAFDVIIEYQKTTTKNLTNEYKKGNLKINKTDSETNRGIKGVKFGLYSLDGTLVGTSTTNDNGEAFFNNIRIGNYKLKELSTNENYILNTKDFDITIEYQKTITKSITNEHKRGNAYVSKVDKDNNKVVLGNVIFDLYSYELDKVIGTYTTNVDGEININNLRIGRYSLIEKNTGRWYNLASNTDISIKWNETTNTVVENELKKGAIKVIKVDKDNNEVRVPGVTFEVLDDNNNVLELIRTDSNGEALTNKYAIRDYNKLKLHEISTNKWYVLNNDIQTVELKANEISTITFENEKKKSQIKVIKTDLDNNTVVIPNVEFEIYDESNSLVDKLKTDENGIAISKKLPIDNHYTIKETKTGKMYVLNDTVQTVELQQDQITELHFTNEKRKGQIRVIKIDADNKEVLLEGVSFNILNSNKDVVDTVITDSNGEAISKRLPIDDTYTLVETNTKKEYVLSEETQTVELKENEITSITFENEKKKGKIRIIKVDLDNNEVLLEGIKFNIIDENNNIVETVITDNKGEAFSSLLPIDQKYTVIEKETLKNYVLSDESQTIELKEDEITSITFANEKKKGKIRVIKIDKDNNKILLEGVKFNIYDEYSNIVDTIITDRNGEAYSKRLPTDKKYTVVEVATDKHYVLTKETKTVELKENEITSITFENEKIKGYVELTKIDSITKEPINNTIFGIYNENNLEIEKIVTDENGKAKSGLLPIGKYYLKELDTGSSMFILNENTYDFEICKNLEIVPITIENDETNIKVTVDKKGTTEIKPGEYVDYVFQNISNESNIYLDNFKWIDYIPTDYIRLHSMTTGTWNQDLKYSVYYKTNKSEDYILFKENLSTQESYKLDFYTLKLQDDEYITQTCFDFGRVDIGFKEINMPTMHSKSFDTLQNNQTFTNKTQTIGTYYNLVAEDYSDWTTIVHIPEEPEKVLPRTGK